MVMSVVIQTAVAETAEGNLTIEGTLAEALSVSCDTSLKFGTISVGANTGLVVSVLVDGTKDVTGTGSTDGHSAGECTFSGSNETGSATITEVGGTALQNASVEIEVGDSGATLTVDQFTVDTPAISSGGGTISIGAKLTIESADLDSSDDFDVFSDTITVTVDDTGV
jgi:hypothetical protein